MDDPHGFPRIVSLACHDLRAPLASVYGFARTIPRVATLPEQAERFLGHIETAATEMANVLEQLTVLARIEDGRYHPPLEGVDTLALAREAASRVGQDRVAASGTGALVGVDAEATLRALAALSRAALHHGRLERFQLNARREAIELEPITPGAVPVVTGRDLRDFGAVAALALIRALGGSAELHGETLRVRFQPHP